VLWVVLGAATGLAGRLADAEEKNSNPQRPGHIAWGPAVNGLEAGIGFRFGEEQSCRIGGSMTFYIYLHNMTDQPISLSHIETLFDEFHPTVEDSTGERLLVVGGVTNFGMVGIVSRSLRPRQTIRLGPCWFLVREPVSCGDEETTTPNLFASLRDVLARLREEDDDPIAPPTLYAVKPGTYRVFHSGFPIRRKGQNSDEFSAPTGRVEFEIKAAADARN
jgi:hypothetical protein